MRSLALLQALLVAFVLVPAGVLGWLGLKAADGYEGEMRTAFQRELLTVGAVLQGRGPAVLAREAQDAEARLQAAARTLVQRLPFAEPRQAVEAARTALRGGGDALYAPLWAGDVRLALVSPRGQALLPREHSQDATPPATDRERLVDDLRREAEAHLFGARDPARAAAVWVEAYERTQDASLRAQLEVEAAWTLLRVDGTAEAAAQAVARLHAKHTATDLEGSGRTWVLLLLRAADRERLLALAQSGLLDQVPLTSAERLAIERLPTPGERRRGVPFVRVEHHRASLPHGLRLHVRRPWPGAALARALMREVVEPLGLPIRATDGQLPAIFHIAGQPFPNSLTHAVEIPRPGRDTMVVVLEHGGMEGLREEVARRRRLTAIGVASLLAVVLLGLLLTRRTVLREREAVRLRDDFLANVSHELRTPLTSVSLHADLLARPDVSPEKRREHVEVVRAEGARLAALVEDLLDFAALERGARRLAPEPVAVLPAVERALAPYRVLAEQGGSVLALDLAPPAPRDLEALADPQALARILANLVGNAFKHGTPAREGGRPTVRVRVGARAGQVVVEVRDNGPGVPREERAHLFERFRRGRAAGVRPGTGLGLALSRGLSRAMGGDLVWAEEPPETVFRLTLPAFDATMGPGGEARA